MKRIYIYVVLLAAFTMTASQASAQTATQAEVAGMQNAVTQIVDTYSAIVTDYNTSLFADNPTMRFKLLELLQTIMMVQTRLNTMQVYDDPGDFDVPAPVFDLFGSDAFGRDSVITEIEVHHSYNGTSRVIMRSDEDEEVVSTAQYDGRGREFTYHPNDRFDNTVNYYKDGDLEGSTTTPNVYYRYIPDYLDTALHDTDSEDEGDWLGAFMVRNPRYYHAEYNGTYPDITPRSCVAEVDEDKFNRIMGDLMEKDDRQHLPLSDITTFYSPTKIYYVDREASSGCRTAAASYHDPEHDR